MEKIFLAILYVSVLLAIKASHLLPSSVTFGSLSVFVTAILIFAYSLYDILKATQVIQLWKPLAARGARNVISQSKTLIQVGVSRGAASIDFSTKLFKTTTRLVANLTGMATQFIAMLLSKLHGLANEFTKTGGKLATTLYAKIAGITISLLAWGSARIFEAIDEYRQQVKIRREAYANRRVAVLNSRKAEILNSKVSFKKKIRANFFAIQWLIYKYQNLRIANETLRAEVHELNSELKILVENWSPQLQKPRPPTAHRVRSIQTQDSRFDIGLNVDFSESSQLTKSMPSRENLTLRQSHFDHTSQL